MYFDFVKEELMIPKKLCLFDQAMNLYENCCNAERNARTDPDSAMVSVRQALKVLVDGLLDADGQDSTGLDLYDMIIAYEKGCDFILDKRVSDMIDILEETEKYVHSDSKVYYHSTCENACNYVEKLYSVIASVFEQRIEKFEWKELPIGKYDIKELCPVKQYEEVDGGYDYIGMESCSVNGKYAFIRPYSNKNSEGYTLSMNNIETKNLSDNLTEFPHIIFGQEIPTMGYCEWKYSACLIDKDYKRLEDISDQLSPADLLDIIMQLAEGLTELIAYVAQDDHVVHKSITPSCIFIKSDNGKYEAKLCCFEPAKVEYFDIPMETVLPFMLDGQKGNRFIHPEMIQGREFTKENWAAGEVFSLAAVLLYCLDKEAVLTDTMDCYVLNECYSEEFAEKMEKILCNGSLDIIPTMADFLDLLRHEMVVSFEPN